MRISDTYSYLIDSKKSTYENRLSKYYSQIAALENENQELKNISQKLSNIGSKIALTALSGNNDLKNLNIDAMVLYEKKLSILKKYNIIKPEFDCTNCCDTGYVDGKVCSCIKNAAIDYLTHKAGTYLPLNECSFEKFNLNYYDDRTEGTTTPRKRMTKIYKFCREYVNNFDTKTSESLIFFGNTGTGKTHLSLSIFQGVLRKGYNVTYDTAFNFFYKIENERFRSSENKTFNDAITVDLLIIDDLGSEYDCSFSQSALLNIIDVRLLANKPTIINTNLSVKDLEKRYSPRFSSRVLCEFTAKKFLGTDIRQQKKLEKK